MADAPVSPDALVSARGADLELPCRHIAPWPRDERLWWAMKCGLERQGASHARLEALVVRLRDYSAADTLKAAQAFQVGALLGVKTAFERYYTDVSTLIRRTLFGLKDAFSTVYDPQPYVDALKVLDAPPGSAEYLHALEETQRNLRSLHPDVSDALRLVAMAILAMNAFSVWLETHERAVADLATMAAESMGTLIGAELERARSVVDSPELFGGFVGELTGEVAGEIVTLIYG